MEKTAVFPGSFDPFTLGHKIIVDEGLKLFDKVIVAVGVNNQKPGFIPVGRRMYLVRDIYSGNEKVEVVSYTGLTVQFCKDIGVKFMLRGMRNTVDFEYERNMMQINQSLYPEIMTVLLFTPPEYVAISSSVVRELCSFGGDVTRFMPEGIDIKKYLK
ncbi:MAG: pantetheine-phosphate adenylyltransferase [Rikenellaceae bacterium]|nr:pantetheine-phosphate adenylyltransferase [Rikenellaceae bacterium]